MNTNPARFVRAPVSATPAGLTVPPYGGTAALTRENKKRTMLLLCSYEGVSPMVRAFIEEAAALASITLFLGMIAIWAQVFSAF
jgi:hypothetical protein